MTKHFGSAQKWAPPTPGSQSLEASAASSVGGMKPAAQGTLFYEFGLELTHRRHQKTKSPYPFWHGCGTWRVPWAAAAWLPTCPAAQGPAETAGQNP